MHATTKRFPAASTIPQNQSRFELSSRVTRPFVNTRRLLPPNYCCSAMSPTGASEIHSCSGARLTRSTSRIGEMASWQAAWPGGLGIAGVIREALPDS